MTDSPTIVALMAHPDDAEFHCGGTLARLSDAGCPVHIVSVTAGQCGTMTHPPDRIAAIRHGEAAAAAAVIGATYHCLDQFDGMLMYDRPTLQLCLDLFRHLKPNVVVTHHPMDYHTDHETTSRLGRTASFLFPSPNSSSAPLAAGVAVPHLYYADAHGGVDFLGRPVTPSLRVEISDQLPRVEAMLQCHASQWEWLRQHQGMASLAQSMIDHARRRGREVGLPAAEAFIQHLGHGYPANDILAELLQGVAG